MAQHTKPLLKWVGGKSQILDTVLAQLPTTMANYWEPFVGGGSVLLGVLSARRAGTLTITGTVYASDLNPNLIGLYQTIQSNPDALVVEVERLVAAHTQAAKGAVVNRSPATEAEALTSAESHYYWVRVRFNALPVAARNTPAAAAMFLFLNKTCFRGLYREGPRGFNVPYGNYKQPTILDRAHLQEVSALLQGVVFSVQPFEAALAAVGPGDVVYLDPPYAPETGTSFVGYTADGFDLESHKRLFELCRQLRGRGASLLLSNADVKLVRDAFPTTEFETTTVVARRAIHSKKPGATTTEVLVRSRPL